MNLEVLLQIRARSEFFVAVFALKRFLTCVDALVPYQVGDLAEGLLAPFKVATVRFFLVVDTSMLLETRVLSKRLITLVAELNKSKWAGSEEGASVASGK